MRSPRPVSGFTAAVAGLIALFAPHIASAELVADGLTRLPPYWVEAEPIQPDNLTSRPFVLARAARLGHANITLKDALADAPGALMQESFGGFEPPRMSIRGSGLQSAPSSRGIAFLLDDFPLGLADGSFNSALVDPVVADRIELVRGDAAARAAPAVLGGAFDLRTADSTSPTAARAEVSSFGGRRAALAGGLLSGPVALNGGASYARQDGFREHSTQDRTTLFAAIRRPALTGCNAVVSIYHARANYEVPGPLTLATARVEPRSASADVRRDQPERDAELTQVNARIEQHNPVIDLQAGISWLHTADRFRQLQSNGISDSHSDDVTFRGSLLRRFDAAGGDHLLRISTVVSRGWRDLRRFRNDAGVTGRSFGHDGLFATTAAIDLEGTARLDENLAFTAGVSSLSIIRDISDRASGPSNDVPTSQRLHSSTVEPRARLTWAAAPVLTLHTSITTAIEPPTFDDLLVVTGSYPNLHLSCQRLANQRATTCEIGTSGTRGALAWDLVAYSAEWRNEILRLADEHGQPRGTVNANPTRHQGIEASLRWVIIDDDHRLSLVSTAAWNRFRFVDDPVYGRNRLAGAPPQLGSVTLLYEQPRGFFAAPAIEWLAGATPVDHAGRLTYGGHSLTHLRTGWRGAGGWTLFVEVKNVFDRGYIASTAGVLDLVRNPDTTAVFLPGVGRSLTVGFELTR